MKIYRVSITADKYPTEYNVEASNWGTAIARACREWAKRFRGSRTTTLKITAIKSGPVLRSADEK